MLDVTIVLPVLPVFDVCYSLERGNDDVSIRSLRVKRLSCP